jgi:hypothetical protein
MTSAPRDSAGYIPWWLLAVVSAACLLAAAVLAGVAVLTRTADLPRPTATIQLVTAPPVAAGPILTAGAPTAASLPTEPSTATVPPPPAGEVRVGSYVQVTGTGEAGFLNLRAEASLNAAVNYLAIEREVFQVQAGPAAADSFTWWYLVDPASGTRFGWAVQNYLQVVQGP